MADENCNPCEPRSNSLFGRIIGGALIDSGNKDKFIDGVDIKVIENQLPDGRREISFNYAPYAAPSVGMSVSPSVFEVGDTVASAVFNFSVTQRSEDITGITVNPDPGIALSVGSNSWSVANVTSGDASNSVALHTGSATDGQNTATASAALSARWRYWQGYSTKPSLNETDIKALANTQISTGIKTIYGGTKTYTVPTNAINQYIYWVYPVGTTGIQNLKSGVFDVPFEVMPNVTVTNAFGIPKTYIVIRTANAFGSGNLQITMS